MGLTRINLSILDIVRRDVANRIKNVELCLWPEVGSIGNATMTKKLLCLLSDITRIEDVWFFCRMSNIASEAHSRNRCERVNKKGIRIGYHQHITFIDRLETTNTGAVERHATMKYLFCQNTCRGTHVLPVAG